MRRRGVCDCLGDDELAQAADLSRRLVYRAGQTLTPEGLAPAGAGGDGAPGGCVFNVRSGMARLARTLPDGRRQIVGFALPGDFIGFDPAARPVCAVEAVTDMAVCAFSRRAFLALAGRLPHMGRRLHELAVEELACAREQMVLLGRRTAEERLACFLLLLDRRWAEIAGGRVRQQPETPLPMSRRDIADYLGLTIETVSRTFRRLAQQQALVITPAGVRIRDPERLRELAAL
ncbi:helix-turn-helix domain-containing protein [Camelimonas abortus]|uniref:helix-turn-helix domain-containing protein n=1 Tax=Camelimonas abortus TaxID=1017184 RepID=UPI0035ECA765